MGISLLPFTRLSDADVAGALNRAAAVINPALDLATRFDPLGLKQRTHRQSPAVNPVDRTLDRAAAILNFAELPGTQAWDDMTRDGHVKWWVRRVGTVTTVAVAFPGAFGFIADRLPVQDALGFANQAILLWAVAREDGVTDRDDQVQLLGAVLCNRDLADPLPEDADTAHSLPGKLWEVAGTLRAVGAELTKRPQPQRVYHYLGMLPGIGAIVDYVGELTALRHAADEAATWISEHSAPAAAQT
ncbi:hypothetical protein FR943_00535 [Mycobacterium sp. TNTM28]|uniref:Uncharacterized protein n=1 Tax=[Mycobacterium] fortunisiensis TaxID=2600579 RepID=A0ABS6KFK7_9MYCO|nr:hypothetical protein [[Mycobacterium] fortunisiensis]MBU9762346.1 hypothetical protein [[Mycobacterium] fortunisiensis]